MIIVMVPKGSYMIRVMCPKGSYMILVMCPKGSYMRIVMCPKGSYLIIVMCRVGEEESPKEGDGEGRVGLKPKRKRDGESEVTAKRNGNTRKDVSEDEDLPNGVAHAASDAGWVC